MIKKKSNGVFLCLAEERLYGALTSAATPPFEIQSTFKADWSDPDERAQILEQLDDAKTGNYLAARIGISPNSRFVRRFEIDPAAKAKSPDYLTNVLKDEFRLPVEEQTVTLITEELGREFDLVNGKETKVIYCGAKTEDLQQTQKHLVEQGLYPQQLELNSVAALGGVVDYTRKMGITGAVLILDITSENSQVFVVREGSVDVTRPIPYGIHSMIPVVKQELGLKDDDSARKLFFSNTFDFTEVGPKLLRKLIRELQASTGFYEVQTGQTIAHIYLPMIPNSLRWIIPVLAEALGVEVLAPKIETWLGHHDISVNTEIDVPEMNEEWFGLFSLICPHTEPKTDGKEEEKQSS